VEGDAATGAPSGAAWGKTDITFRLPTSGDVLAVADDANAVNELARRCIRPGEISGGQRRRVESLMESIAPSLSQDLLGECPECGATVSVFFDPRRYCLREFRDLAAFVYQDIDILARRYHWSESDILALPRTRRLIYAEMAREEIHL
jgi:hypothetical protein